MNKNISTYICCLIMFVFGIVLSILSPLLTEISEDFSLNMAQSGIIFTISFSGFILFILLGGVLAEKTGKKKIVLAALLGYAIAMFILANSSRLFFVYIAIFFVGGFGGILESLVSALVVDINKDNHGYYLNLIQIFLCMGAVIGPIFGGYMVSSGGGWRMSYFVLAGASLLSFILLSRNHIEESAVSEKIEIRKFKDTISDKKFVIVCLCMFLYAGTEVGVWGWMATFLKTDMSFSISKSSLIVGVFWISMTIGRILCGKLINLFSIKGIITFLAYLSAVVIFISGLLTNEILIWVVVIATGLAFSSLYPFIVSIGSGIRSNATACTVIIGSGGIGAIVVPFIMGVIGEYMGVRTAMMSPSVLMLIVGMIFTFMRKV